MKKKLLALLLGTSLLMGLAACGSSSSDKSTSDTSKKQTSTDTTQNTASSGDANQIFQQHCSSCHGGDLKGGVGPNLTKIGSQLSKQQILDTIKNGKSGGMPAGLISGSDADKVATWLSAKK